MLDQHPQPNLLHLQDQLKILSRKKSERKKNIRPKKCSLFELDLFENEKGNVVIVKGQFQKM